MTNIEIPLGKQKLLFVVHRFYPFIGGSEYYVYDMAKEMVARGHDVTVLAHTIVGNNVEQIKVTNDYNVIGDPSFNLIIVHGGDCVSQDIVHQAAHFIPAPVLYLIIKPSASPTCQYAANRHRFLGYSTVEDYEYIKSLGRQEKARRVGHGINWQTTTKIEPYTFAFPKKSYFFSAGGYWKHKGFDELAEVCNRVLDARRARLVLCGYANIHDAPPASNVVFPMTKEALAKPHVMTLIQNAKAYVMNSTEEGFGLVLLEALANNIPIISRKIAGAIILEKFATVYETKEELEHILRNFDDMPDIKQKTLAGQKYVEANCTIKNTCNDIEAVLIEARDKK